jgi:ABC-type phosphate transport system substrate-binding protein
VLSAVIAGLATTQTLVATAVIAQEPYVPISGSGSTWSFNALDQWRRNVEKLNGLRINFAPNGSSQGRAEFKNGTVDFAVSEIEYGLFDGGVRDNPPDKRNFAYMPIVAGGTAFMYNLKIGNNRVTNLRLSGEQGRQPRPRPAGPADRAGDPRRRVGHNCAVHPVDGCQARPDLGRLLRAAQLWIYL